MLLSLIVLYLCCTGTIYADSTFEFALRPVHGNQREGYIKMKVNSTWGIMSRSYASLDETTASILCRSLQLSSTGFSTSSNVELNLFENTLNWYNLIQCDGKETEVGECVQGTPSYNWVTTLPRGWTRLHCFAFEISGVRLSGGEVPHIGSLEVKVGERWGRVCVYGLHGFGHGVSITCSLLGYNRDSSVHQSYEAIPDDEPATEAWLSGLQCLNSTRDVNNCSYFVGINGPCATDAYIRCEPMQFVNGSTSSSGIIKAGLFGQFQMICGTSKFNSGAANVTCNLLGHRRVSRLSAVKPSPDNTGPVFNGSIHCTGTEQSLELCDITQEQAVCEGSTVMYIECLDGPLHIVPIGNKSNEGFLLYYWNDWYVHGGDVSNTTVKTLCYLLGHGFNGSSSYEPMPVDITPNSPSILSSLQCFGYETDVAQCQKSPLIIHTCWRCPNEIPTTFLVLYCAECQPGFFGTHCSECNCNNRSTVPCDTDTGECTCQTGWYGTSCEYDIDECVTTTCPHNSDCINVPGSYECICGQGYVRTVDVCQRAPEDTEEKINPLVIILSSVIGGLVLLCTIAIICLCKYRMKVSEPNPNPVSSNDVHRLSNEHNLSSTKNTDYYNMIDDRAVGVKSNVIQTDTITDPYDTLDDNTCDRHMDTRPKNEIKELSDQHEVTAARHEANTENYDYPYSSPPTIDGETGYIKLQGSHVTYQHLQHQVRPEHVYDKVKH